MGLLGQQRISLLVLFTCMSTILQTSQAQNSPQDYLNPHNSARAQVRVGPMRWNNTVATYARRLVHSGGPYGENIAWSSGDLSGTDAVRLWVAEKADYDYNSNSCAAGKVCGHYTQVVWRNSVHLGCAKVRCNNNRGTFIVCNYDPRGNIIGQRPY